MSLLSWTDAWWQALAASTFRHRLMERYHMWRARRWFRKLKGRV